MNILKMINCNDLTTVEYIDNTRSRIAAKCYISTPGVPKNLMQYAVW